MSALNITFVPQNLNIMKKVKLSSFRIAIYGYLG